MLTHARVDDAHSHLEFLRNSLKRHPLFLRRDLKLTMKNQLVTIEGQVSTYYEKQMAQETLRSLIGNQQVVNELTVVPEENWG